MKNTTRLMIKTTADALALPLYAVATVLTGDNTATPVLDRMSSSMRELAEERKKSIERKEDYNKRVKEAVEKVQEEIDEEES